MILYILLIYFFIHLALCYIRLLNNIRNLSTFCREVSNYYQSTTYVYRKCIIILFYNMSNTIYVNNLQKKKLRIKFLLI